LNVLDSFYGLFINLSYFIIIAANMRTYYNISDQLNTATRVWIRRNTSAMVWCTQRHQSSLTYTL